MHTVTAPDAPAAIGPYSHAVINGDTVYCSGQTPLDPATMTLVGTTIEAQTEQVMNNLKAVLEAAGSGPEKILKTTIFLASMDDFAAMNPVYENALDGHKPARTTIQAAGLPLGAMVEIDCIAALK